MNVRGKVARSLQPARSTLARLRARKRLFFPLGSKFLKIYFGKHTEIAHISAKTMQIANREPWTNFTCLPEKVLFRFFGILVTFADRFDGVTIKKSGLDMSNFIAQLARFIPEDGETVEYPDFLAPELRETLNLLPDQERIYLMKAFSGRSFVKTGSHGDLGSGPIDLLAALRLA